MQINPQVGTSNHTITPWGTMFSLFRSKQSFFYQLVTIFPTRHNAIGVAQPIHHWYIVTAQCGHGAIRSIDHQSVQLDDLLRNIVNLFYQILVGKIRSHTLSIRSKALDFSSTYGEDCGGYDRTVVSGDGTCKAYIHG